MTRQRKRNKLTTLNALDLVLSGYDTVIGSDFIIQKKDPYNADIGHLDPLSLRTFDQNFIDSLVSLKPIAKVLIPNNLKDLLEKYKANRNLLLGFNEHASDIVIDHDIKAAKELQNFDPYIKKVVIRNHSEFCLFYEYILLYRKVNYKRAIFQYSEYFPDNNVYNALLHSNLALLRIDEVLAHGAIKTINVIDRHEYLIFDETLNRTSKAGMFLVGTLLNIDSLYLINCGIIFLDPNSFGGKSILTLFKKHLDNLRIAKTCNNKTMDCAREVFGIALRSGCL